MDNEEETIIDLSKFTTSDACLWLLHSLRSSNFIDHPYTIPFCTYVMTWHRAVPLQSILILQSPYPNDIFPPIAAAMSYDTDLCKKKMQGREMPPTIQVLVNDMYINGGMEKEDSIALLKNGWALVDKGILMINETVFYPYKSEEGYIESAIQCSVIIRLLRETEKHGKRTVNIYAFGEAGEKTGSDLCSWYKSSIVTLTKRKVTHPAGIARRFDNLDGPECHMGTPSFTKSLVKSLRNHVAFMHTMSKKSSQDFKYQRLQEVLGSLHRHFPTHEQSLIEWRDLNRQAMELPQTSSDHKEILRKLDAATDDLITRFRVTGSVLNGLQSRGGSVSNTISKSASTMKTERPSESLVSEHTGQEHSPRPGIVGSETTIKLKPMKIKKPINSTETSSFTAVSSPPSVSSLPSESSPSIKIKPAKKLITPSKSNAITPSKLSVATNSAQQNSPSSQASKKDVNEEADTLSPLAKFSNSKNTMRKPQIKGSKTSAFDSSPSVFNPDSVKLSKQHIHALSSVEAVVEANKELDDDDRDQFEIIENDIKSKTIYNNITKRLTEAIDKDTANIADFDFSQWIYDPSKSSATFDLCKEEFSF